MSQASKLYALNHKQVAHMIVKGGNKRTVLVRGHMGTGKSSLLHTLGQMLPDHILCYFDCTTKDVGDISIPHFMSIENGCVRHVPNEELGIHLGKDVIVCIDELGKASPGVKNALLRFMLERKMGAFSLTENSIVFATTNLGSEGLGDMLLPHALNRITVVHLANPQQMEFIEWGINNGIDHSVLGWCKEQPALFMTFEDYPENISRDDFERENPYVYHPKHRRAGFVTCRALHAASDWVKLRDTLDDQTLTAALIGTLGDRGALDLMAHVSMSKEMPKIADIKADPMTAKLPESAAARCLIIYHVLSNIERDWVDPWMTYLCRMSKDEQALFGSSVRAEGYNEKRRSIVMTNGLFQKWARDNTYMFTTDKK
jgi:hypothetical protein